jgi:hypothetical protein
MSRKFVFGGSFTSFVFDNDALAYFAVNPAITLDADKLAIDSFFKGLKSDGIYSLIHAMYLPIWASATDSKWNLKNPLDTNGAFRLTFSGGITFSSGGMQGNGSNGFANTHYNPNTQQSNTSAHVSIYSRTNNQRQLGDEGAFAGNALYSVLSLRNTSNVALQGMWGDTSAVQTSSLDSRGFFVGTRQNATTNKLFRNGTQLAVNTSATIGTRPNLNKFIMSINGLNFYSNREYSFYSVGDALTDTQQSDFYNRVQTLMTYFGINV